MKRSLSLLAALLAAALLLLPGCAPTAPVPPEEPPDEPGQAVLPDPVPAEDPPQITPTPTGDPEPAAPAVPAPEGLDAVLRARGLTPEPAPAAAYEDLRPITDFYTDAPISCRYGAESDAGAGALHLSDAYPPPAFTLTAETAAGTLTVSRPPYAESGEPEANALTLALGDAIVTCAPAELTDIAVARLDGANEYLLLYDNGPLGDPRILLFRLTGGLTALGALPNRDPRGDGAGLLTGQRLSCFTEDPLLTWYTLDGGLTEHTADPAGLAGRTFTARFDIYGQLPDSADWYGLTDEWIPEGERVVIEAFPGEWYNDWLLRRADGTAQHYLLWTGE